MRTQRRNHLGTLLLPLLLAVALVVSISVAACSGSTADEPVEKAPVAEEEAGHDDAAEHDDADGHDADAGEHNEGDTHDNAASDSRDDTDAVADHGEADEFVVTMTDQLTYGPEEIVVPAGEPIRLVINNDGQALHDFTVDQIAVTHMHHEGGSMDTAHMAGEGHDEYDLHMALDGGDAGVLEFIPGEPGEYVFHCSVPGHTEAGMHGELVVRATE